MSSFLSYPEWLLMSIFLAVRSIKPARSAKIDGSEWSLATKGENRKKKLKRNHPDPTIFLL